MNRSTPGQVSGLAEVVAIAAGGTYSLALKADGTVWTWGWNELGDGTAASRWLPAQVNGLTGVAAIAAGGSHNVALKRDGTVWTWGANSAGQLGDGSITERRTTPVQVNGLAGAAAVAAGSWHSLALKSDGTIWAWGGNESGQVGDGATTYRSTRIQVGGVSGVKAVAGGAEHSAALERDGTVWTWGANEFGQLGDGTTTTRPTPGPVSWLTEVAAIAAGDGHNLALKDDGTVWAWGSNWHGQLGDAATSSRPTPVPGPVSGLSQVAAIAAGDGHNLALKDDGTVWAWGSNSAGQLGAQTTTKNRSTPVRVTGLSEVVGIAAGRGRSLALTRDGTVWAWGNGYLLYDGYGTTSGMAPVQVGGLSGIVSIAAGYQSFGEKGDGTVWAWEFQTHGISSTPVQVSGLRGATAFAIGSVGDMCTCEHYLAVKRDGTVWAWDDASVPSGAGYWSTAVQVAGLTGVVAIAVGPAHSLAVKDDGTVWAWGDNDWGQLGDERTGRRTTPVQVIPPGSPDLAIAMSHNGDFTAGSKGVYTLTLTNTGATPTDGTITIVDTLPPGLSYVSATGTDWTCSAADETVTCTNSGPVNPGASSPITLTVDVGSAAYPGVTNFAIVANASDRNISNNAVADPTVVSAGR
jgi:uncharacterized repeat protein (TIGR01451 family)